MKRLARLEARVESLVEGTIAWLLAGRLQAADLAIHLTRALEDSAASGAAAPAYLVHLPPADHQALLAEQTQLADALAENLVAAARQAGLTLHRRPEIAFVPDPALRRGEVRVAVNDGEAVDTGRTQNIPLSAAPQVPSETLPAFLIVDGQRTVPLRRTVVSLGRRLDNDIVLDDARVSRAHAQLRLRFGRYVLYDLGSAAGSFVNGERVQECILQPGDVISLAGLPLIYGEDELHF